MTETTRNLQAIGKAAYESIAEMVAALECDYNRLEEVKGLIQDIMDADDIDNGDDSASDLLAELREELADLQKVAGDCASREDAETRIQEDPLSVLVRSGWYTPNDVSELSPEEFEILLTTGGPAVRIRGELNQYLEPSRAWLEVQDWGTPWTQYFDVEPDTLLTYCRQFYFGG